ncbi:MAG TPA: hypothetical protein VKX17_23300 [Planctomycetota bacterium]|nr:hypothetical protein [Planctomycetota bacterium]
MKLKCAFALALACLSLPSFAIEADFNAASWGNNGPYALSNLKNKLVVLYFFEEG